MPLQNRRILLGVSGGIAAYKGVEVMRRLQKAGAEVRVVMTKAAQKFVQPLTFEALSHHKVYTDLFPSEGDPDVIHVMLGNWPDLIVVVPATANLIGKMAHGLADDLLTCTLLSSSAPVLLAPAMETQMYVHPAVQRNLAFLKEAGYAQVGPESGDLASGTRGVGRLSEPKKIVEAVSVCLGRTQDFRGKRIVVTAGRTEQDIDPVRFITNRSTGKMGNAGAQQSWMRGAEVVLSSGPRNLEPPSGVEVIGIRTVADLKAATTTAFKDADALIMTAAVLDFRPKEVSAAKIKKLGAGLSLDLVPNDDFLVSLGKNKGDRVVVGFAMETEQGLENARKKLEAKHLDLIVLNNLTDEGAGFAVDTNVVTLIESQGQVEALPLMSKQAVADRILDWVGDRWG
ncbi:MAG: bifunctional phosphopantothenoylcysteine decarboxylase/phosphopantothenate--cysteine ligase CoaBC [bacterium]|nr:bifunctional phosphopantothenoylcysteine decarboxylase/phosphopantothenate--cysteine ligase CoaBC [bacterium]